MELLEMVNGQDLLECWERLPISFGEFLFRFFGDQDFLD